MSVLLSIGGPARLAMRLSCFYAAFNGTVAVALAFWPLWLESRGLDAAAIGVVLGVERWVKVASSPLIGRFTDRWRRVRPIMIILPVVSLIAYAAFALASTLPVYLFLSVVVGSTLYALLPLGESVTLRSAVCRRLDYGRIRLWGSISFVVTSLVVGFAVRTTGPSWILPILLVGVATILVACLLIPEIPRQSQRSQWAAMSELARPKFLILLVAAGAVMASHVGFYGFSSIHWRNVGHSEAIIGALWAEAVSAEILLFLMSSWVTRRVTPAELIVLGGLAGVVRWSFLATTTDLTVLCGAQLLHGLTFGATHLGVMEYLRRNVPEGLVATAACIYTASVGGLAFGLSMPVAGVLFGASGAWACFSFAAGLSVVGALVASLLQRSVRETGLAEVAHE